MFWRWTALVGLAAVLAPLAVSATDGPGSSLTNTGFRDWTGLLSETTLKDNSVLSEYMAVTRSENTPGAMLQVSFVPRFGCTPQLRVVVDKKNHQASSELEMIWLWIDGEKLQFPALVDTTSTSHEYSLMADHSRQQEMRAVLDRASHLHVHWKDFEEEPAAGVASESDDIVRFSLLGSRLSVEGVESHCNAHVPLPYDLPVQD